MSKECEKNVDDDPTFDKSGDEKVYLIHGSFNSFSVSQRTSSLRGEVWNMLTGEDWLVKL